MNELQIQCLCGTRLELPATCIGRATACPSCQSVVRIVGADPGPDTDIRACLIIRKGPKRIGEQIFLVGSQDIMIGKMPGTNILLSGPAVSRTHGRLTAIPGGWRIEDQASTNGIFINGKKLPMHALAHNDRLRIGEYEFLYMHKPPVQRVEATFAVPPDDEDA